MKIWVKLIRDDRIMRDKLLSIPMVLTSDNYDEMLRTVAESIDGDTPLSLPAHYRHLKQFNVMKYLPAHFVAPVDFDYMLIEVVG